jgi:hypothetical protein
MLPPDPIDLPEDIPEPAKPKRGRPKKDPNAPGSLKAPKGLSRKQLQQEPEAQYRLNTRETLQKYWKAINLGLDNGDPKILKIVSEMYNMTKAPGGTTIYNNTQINSAKDPEAKRARSFDAIINMIEDKAAVQKALAAPAETSEPDIEELEELAAEDGEESGEDGEDGDDIEDAETEDFEEE